MQTQQNIDEIIMVGHEALSHNIGEEITAEPQKHDKQLGKRLVSSARIRGNAKRA
jgi:hypothetical protein